MDRLWTLMPPAAWAAFCLAIAAVYVKFWPRNRALDRGPVRRFILRWFHALVWLLLAAAILLRGGESQTLASALALLALLVYLTFLVVNFASRKPS